MTYSSQICTEIKNQSQSKPNAFFLKKELSLKLFYNKEIRIDKTFWGVMTEFKLV